MPTCSASKTGELIPQSRLIQATLAATRGSRQAAESADNIDSGGATSGLASAGKAEPEAGTSSASSGGEGCGNHHLEPEEECDGPDLGNASCEAPLDPTRAAAGGVLHCSEQCEQTFEACYAVRALSAGLHACSVLSNARLKCWGYNDSGQLGLGDRFSRGEDNGEMGGQLPFIDLDERRVLEVATGMAHTCALLESNEVICWGDNSWGQLGRPSAGALGSSTEAGAMSIRTLAKAT